MTHPPRLTACIFDVDGVLLKSPHERAWREALIGLAEPSRFTTAMYQDHVAGKPRAAGALAALSALDVPDAAGHAAAYAERKQARLEALIRAKAFSAFPDALRFVHALDQRGWRMAVASSSRNANSMLRLVPFDEHRSLFDVFAVNVCGRDLPRGKPDPAIFLLAARELGLPTGCCFVAEDAVAGVEAARAGAMAAVGVARLADAAILRAAGASVTVTSLDQVDLTDLASGRLSRQAA